jgi:hypothetical protein
MFKVVEQNALKNGSLCELRGVLVPILVPKPLIEHDRAFCRVKSRFLSEICHEAARSGLDPSNRPQTIKLGLWGRQSLHQSLLKRRQAKRPLTKIDL